jgi:hypothetical protein
MLDAYSFFTQAGQALILLSGYAVQGSKKISEISLRSVHYLGAPKSSLLQLKLNVFSFLKNSKPEVAFQKIWPQISSVSSFAS